LQIDTLEPDGGDLAEYRNHTIDGCERRSRFGRALNESVDANIAAMPLRRRAQPV
jgi:hypothetical protein